MQQERECERKKILAQFSGPQQYDELYKLDKKYFGHYDTWLDRCVAESPRWLAQEPIARIVAEQIHALDGERYRLITYCLMPNHGHLLIDTAEFFPPQPLPHAGRTAPYPLTDTLKRLKGSTARYCNQALERTGAFWNHESYDHVVRDEKEYRRIIWYILNNPVKAGLAEKWESWAFTYSAE